MAEYNSSKWSQTSGNDSEKPIYTALPRLQCMFLHLQKYDYTIQYIPGKDMVLADRLSKFPSHKNNIPV